MKATTSTSRLLLLIALSCCYCSLGQASIGELYEDFHRVANVDKVKTLLEDRLEAGDEDVLRVVQYLKSPDFRTIYNYMWDGNNTREVHSNTNM